ncbi:hypothetical protein C3747_276g23 [Trypanosoma cruzi]|uniref:Uncharacterized protein n=2 Tax=Trypanosoma cruzi TaxID=5693 RepID=Q4D0S0_TRYCC|nr:hypothetical protein, conserved [Trypanosoma cruzi]EAN86125.1 hypothetical protein, conserved [Trypanosoma cruzi]PWU94585.1 hypothetical protein C3747_276g23 [Trypanosoma cruzi]RNC58448.1 hypothetical protein TcCL_ESM03912 [Trypanosoma cruzi]|eukprot:XP_807976.1 hypothetical protein [Trypanosoma cruzi strain CL Brener]
MAVMERRESEVDLLEKPGNKLYVSGQCNEIVLNCWTESARRQCLPSLMRVDSPDRKRTPSPLYHPLSLSTNTEKQQQQPLPCINLSGSAGSFLNTSEDEVLMAWNVSPDTQPQADPAQARGKRPQSSELHQAIKVALGKRWRPYANGAIRRYNVPSKLRGGSVNHDGRQESPFKFIEEMAQRHAEAQAEKRLPHDVFAPQQLPPRQFVVRLPDVDPRRVADEVNAKPKTLSNAEIPTELLHRKVLFDATLGAVKPYALRERGDQGKLQQGRRRKRPGEVPPSMPLTAFSRDPLEVFVEAMRYQRPALGVYTFDVY